ncbi:MAG: glutaredoxin 3 [Pseudomonadales bacterium]|nr:glutaredoxin 3 [Pseudomonadales bacterium]
MPKIEIYTTSICPFCTRAKHLLKSKGLKFDETSVDFSSEKRQEMINRSGRRTVPQIWINGRHVGGCDDLFELEYNGQLDEWLNDQQP